MALPPSAGLTFSRSAKGKGSEATEPLALLSTPRLHAALPGSTGIKAASCRGGTLFRSRRSRKSRRPLAPPPTSFAESSELLAVRNYVRIIFIPPASNAFRETTDTVQG